MLRDKIPSRSNPAKKKKHGDYKADLRADFNRKCGYCDDGDENYGYAMGFHIDHFAPKKYFPELEVEYANLVYSCPVCNRAKGAKWIGNDSSVSHNGTYGFVDPCLEEFDNHLTRKPNGVIVALSPLGEYKIRELKLNLLRHQLNWQLEMLLTLMQQLSELATKVEAKGASLRKVNDALADITRYYVEVGGRRRASH